MNRGHRSHHVLPVPVTLRASCLEEVEGAEGTLCTHTNTEMCSGLSCAPRASRWGMVLALPGAMGVGSLSESTHQLERGKSASRNAPRGMQDPGVCNTLGMGLTQSWCVVGCIGGLCSSMELDTASSVHARRCGHRADSIFLVVSITLHPSSPQSFPPATCWQYALGHPMSGTGRDFAPQQAPLGAVWPAGPGGRRYLAPISPWVPWAMLPAPWVLSLSDAPRHAPNKGQTLNGDKALSQVLQAGLNRLSISN